LEEALQILNPMTSTIFWSIIVFVILAVLLWKFALKPINNIISRREKEIREKLDDADRKNRQARRYLEEQKEAIEDSRAESQKIIDENRNEAKKIKEEIEKKAHDRARVMIEEAMEDIGREKKRAIVQVKDEIVGIALDASRKVVSASLSKEDHKRIIEESIKELGKVETER
jgi:F-type H+-transporting ATPase subunit b